MELKIKSLDGSDAGSVELPDEIFGLEPRADILHRCVRWQLANRQRPGIVPQGLAATASLIGSAYTVHQGLQNDNPLQVAAGLTGAAGAYGSLAGWQETSIPSLGVQLAGRAVSTVGAAMRQDQVGAALAATQGAQLWNLIRAIDISPQLTQLGSGTPVSPTSGASSQGSFSDSLVGLLDAVDRSAGDANSAIAGMVRGTGDVHEAMIALQRAETSLQITVQVRNKLVQAYQDIMRMPI